jgi:four helix bundle protein
MRDFRGLRVWERAHRLALEVNTVLARVPRRGFAHVVSQGQRAALSVSTNIVEGCGHASKRELSRYLRMSLASANELEYHLLVASDLGLIDRTVHQALEAETQVVKRMLYALIGRVGGGQ